MLPKLEIMVDEQGAQLPVYARFGDAGADLRAVFPEGQEEATIYPGQHLMVSTGLRMAIPDGYEVQIRPRSGLAFKHGVTVLNSPGTIDSKYRGVVGVILINHGGHPFKISTGDRIAQMVVARLAGLELIEVETIDNTERGEGGFGSTGRS